MNYCKDCKFMKRGLFLFLDIAKCDNPSFREETGEKPFCRVVRMFDVGLDKACPVFEPKRSYLHGYFSG